LTSLVALGVDEPIDPVARREARCAPFPVLLNALGKATRNSRIERARSVRHDV